MTTQLAGGYLRPNGVPFSELATVKEFFNTFTLPGEADAWLIVTPGRGKRPDSLYFGICSPVGIVTTPC